MRWTSLVSLLLAGVFAVHAFAEEAPPSDEEARRAKVFATVGSGTITVGQLEDMINSRSPYARKRFAKLAVLEEFADDQVRNELFYQGAEKLGYAQDPEVAKFVNQTMVQLFVRKEFEESVTPDDVPEVDVAKYYEDNPDEFRRPEMRRARHILVASEEDAEGILAQLKSDKNAMFRSLAKQRSLDTETKLRGGDLLYFTEDGKLVGKQDGATVNATLAKTAFELRKAGDLSKPLDLGDGQWSVLELTGIRAEAVQSLEQASAGIRRKLWRAEREAALDELMTKLRSELKPEVYPDRMDAIVLAPTTEPVEPPDQ
jgi:peptidyl-prolyl cis-trans isomerase C